MEIQTPPLHLSQVQQSRATMNRLHTLIHSMALLSLLYYRVWSLLASDEYISIIPWVLITASELLLSFFWVLGQAYRWRPVKHRVFPERLPCDYELPALDVFICTADPGKEPPVDVMNTVISAMSLDYPPAKLSVYLSDDAGAPITLFAIREAFAFARSWVPFCKKYEIKTRCPEAYFSELAELDDEGGGESHNKFMAHREEIKLKYKGFKQKVDEAQKDDVGNNSSSQNHHSLVKVMRGSEINEGDESNVTLPLLVYVSREKRPSHPHHFKAGALNVLFRVSAIISNAPYVLALDCDMYCNNAASARQAMCFHLDPHISPSLAFVQFFQAFHNMSKNDIYNGLIYLVFEILWYGMNGLKGPILSGTGFYLKRESLFRSPKQEGVDLLPGKQIFGPSDEFIASLQPDHNFTIINWEEETRLLASCTYEKDTQWGEEIGFMYHSVVEDYFTGFRLHCKGWNSVYYYPSMPAFLGSVTTNLNENLVQTTRWNTGLLQVGLSRFSPLIYGSLRMSVLQSMCFAYLALQPLGCFPLLCLSFVPQLCLLNGIPVYPKVSNPWVWIFPFVYVSCQLQYLLEVLTTGGSVKLWWNQMRICLWRTVTAYSYSCADIAMRWIGVKEIKFMPTNKVANEEQDKRYNMDIFDFYEEAKMFVLPLTTIVNLNMATLVLGLRRAIIDATFDEMFGQMFLSFLLLCYSYPIVEAMFIRKDRGRISKSITLTSMALVTTILSLDFCY